MTVSSSTSRVQFNGNGSTTVFAYSFKIFDQDDLTVIVRSATGTETVKTITTHYTVSGVGNAGGGNVTMLTAPASGETLTILREQDLVQELDLVENDPFPAQSLEDALDKLTFMVQQHSEEIDRSIKASRTNTITSTEFTVSAASRANKIFAFDSAGELAVTQELGTYRGNWATSTAFAQRDIVKDTSNNNIYICLTAHTSTGSQPISSNADVAKWALLVDAASATTSASAAASSASAAATSATNAANSATAASGSASAASSSASAASTSETNAAASAAAAAASFDAFDDIYLGSKSSDPSVDNDGNALTTGDQYFNSVANELRIWNGSAWQAASTVGGTVSSLSVTGDVTIADKIVHADDTNTAIRFPAADTVTVETGGSERMRIDSTGNVGIGVTPSAWATVVPAIQIGGGGSFIAAQGSGGANSDSIYIGTNAHFDGTDWKYKATNHASYFLQANGVHQWFTAPSGTAGNTITFTEAARIDSSGNLLVGKTTSGTSVGAGVEASANGSLFATRDLPTANSDAVAFLNRETSFGDIIRFRKDGTTIGVIGNASTGTVYVGSGDTTLTFSPAGDAIVPSGTDGATRSGVIDLGNSANRWDTIFATVGTINTSDRTEKQDIEELNDAERRVAVACKGLLRKYRLKSAVALKGEDARIHFGIIAQDLQAAFTAEGLDAGRYGMFIHSTWTDEETGEEKSLMGVRYSELLAFMISVL